MSDDAPRPRTAQERATWAKIIQKVTILSQWWAADPERVAMLYAQGKLFEEMYRAERSFYRARPQLWIQGADWEQADELCGHHILWWESKEEVERQRQEIEDGRPEGWA
ncbi:MAG: hypothetical protein OXM01_04900 [Gemmatimonadota bacterium]|nr:hypothetical protein [Gemmatimonadota bacterium]